MDNYIKRINSYIQNYSLWVYILYSTLIISGIELLVFGLGFLIAIPTDYGRIFAFSASAFFITLYIYSIICFNLMKFLLKLKEYNNIAYKSQKIDLKKFTDSNSANEFILKALRFFMSEDELKRAKIILETEKGFNSFLKAYFLDRNMRNELNKIIDANSIEKAF